ncbi:MAG: glycosyltransferase family 2 protein [Halobacterium sp.]
MEDRASSTDESTENDSGYRLVPDWWWDFSREDVSAWIPTPERDQFPGPVPEHVERPFAADRLLTAFFVVVFAVALLAVFDLLVYVPARSHLLAFVYAGLWVFVGVYVVPTVIWAYEAYLGWGHDPPEIAYGPESVQVRILTVDAEAVVQETVDALPDAITDRHVIAEEPLAVDGATVHVVPDGFECEASRKGRALEWARRGLACEREFVLFLDEDTLVTEFEGLPDADLVQFREWPMYTGSYVTYWAEVLRMGYQTEQTGFEKLDIPLYAWGGGIAVRKAVEDDVTWNFDTLIEDTVFAWQAVKRGASFEVMDTKFRNQAPPSMAAMLRQRRRWLVGTLREETHLPRWFHVLDTVRNVSWAFSPVTPFLLWFSHLVPAHMPARLLFQVIAQGLFVFSLVWVWRGWRYYEGPSLWLLPVFVIYPFVVALHSLEATWGLVSPPGTFETTAKTSRSDDETDSERDAGADTDTDDA